MHYLACGILLLVDGWPRTGDLSGVEPIGLSSAPGHDALGDPACFRVGFVVIFEMEKK